MSYRPRVGIDCDDVLAGFTPKVIELVAELTGVRHNIEDVDQWDLFDWLDSRNLGENNKALGRKVYDVIKAEGGCFSLDVLEGSKEGIKRLQDISDVFIITAPFVGSKTWVHERYEWLRHHFGIHHRRVAQLHEKALCKVDVFVDDKLDNVVRWGSENYGRAVLWDRSSNRKEATPPWVVRCFSWEQLYEIVASMAKK